MATERRSGVSSSLFQFSLRRLFGFVAICAGVVWASISHVHRTDRKFDLQIDGDGFFQLRLPDGGICFTRDGEFHVNFSGQLSWRNGYLLEPTITIPNEAIAVRVHEEGTVTVVTKGNPTMALTVGSISIATISQPSELLVDTWHDGVMAPSANYKGAIVGTPGTDGFGVIRQGFRRQSNGEWLWTKVAGPFRNGGAESIVPRYSNEERLMAIQDSLDSLHRRLKSLEKELAKIQPATAEVAPNEHNHFETVGAEDK